MKLAAVEAIAALAREAPSEVAARAYGGEARTFGPGSLIPNPFDPRLILRIAPAVARAAMESGVATRPIVDFDAVRGAAQPVRVPLGLHHEAGLRHRRRPRPSAWSMPRARTSASCAPPRWWSRRAWRIPILVGRPGVIEKRLERFGLSIRPGRDFALINPEDDPRYRDFVQTYVEVAGRRGITPEAARTLVRTNATVIAALAVRRGEADAMICGVEGRFLSHLRHIRDIIGFAPGRSRLRRAHPGDHREGPFLPGRHPCVPGSDRRGDRRDGGARRRPCAALRHQAQDRALVAFQFRQPRHRIGTQDAARDGAI